MKKIKKIIPVLALSLILLNGCSSLNVGEGLTKIISKQLGVTDVQALGGVGAILTLAQQKLAKGDFDKLAKIIPGSESYLNIAKLVGKLTGPVNSVSDLAPAFKNLGMDAGKIGEFVPAVTNYASMAGGSGVADMLGNVLK